MPNLIKTARAFADSFETRKRDDGTEFVCLKDDSPEWMTDVIHEAHGDMGPDDWRYRMISEVADSIAETLEDDSDADLDDEMPERIDGLVPIYNWDRLKWLSSHLGRASYCDDAVREGFADGRSIFDTIGAGLYAEYSEIWYAVQTSLAENAEEDAS